MSDRDGNAETRLVSRIGQAELRQDDPIHLEQ
jgi:hypothetical protein